MEHRINTKPVDQNIIFYTEGNEMIKLCENGDIYVKGKLIENDKEVVEGMREFLEASKH